MNASASNPSTSSRCDDCGEDVNDKDKEDVGIRYCQYCKRNICDICEGAITCEGFNCSRLNCIDCVCEEDDAFNDEYVQYCSSCERAFCSDCRPFDCGVVCRSGARLIFQEMVPVYLAQMPSWFRQKIDEMAKDGLTADMTHALEFWVYCLRHYPPDKDFNVQAYTMLDHSRDNALALAIFYFLLGWNYDALYMLFYVALLDEIEDRGPDYTNLLFDKKLPRTPAALGIFFDTLWDVANDTSTEGNLYAYLMGRVDRCIGIPAKAKELLLESEDMYAVSESESPIHSMPALFDACEEQIDRSQGCSEKICITMSKSDGGESELYDPYNDTSLGWLLKIYAIRQAYFQTPSTIRAQYYEDPQTACTVKPEKYFRVTHKLGYEEQNGKMLFLSSSGKKTLVQLEIKDCDTIIVTGAAHEEEDDTKQGNKKKSSNTGSNGKSEKKSKKKNKGGKKKKKQEIPTPQLSEEQLMEKYRQEHSKAMTPVFEQLEPQLKDIRNALNALTLEREKPKVRKANKKKKGTPDPGQPLLPPDDGLGGKAGKVAYPILVGEISNLYKTFKSSSSAPIMVDLHSLTKEEALNTLNESLPTWVDTAMKGEYPWVIPVDIICGGGNQVLSDVVGIWIKENHQVANRPRAS